MECWTTPTARAGILQRRQRETGMQSKDNHLLPHWKLTKYRNWKFGAWSSLAAIQLNKAWQVDLD
jgi:hypothetical protein